MQQAFDEKKDGAIVPIESEHLLRCMSIISCSEIDKLFCQPNWDTVTKMNAAALGSQEEQLHAIKSADREPKIVEVIRSDAVRQWLTKLQDKAERLQELVDLSK